MKCSLLWRFSGVAAVAFSAVAAHAQAVPKPPSFAMCGVCHKTSAAEKSVLGPNLAGTAGRKSGTIAGYAFSPAMKASKIVWNRDTLIAYIAAPAKVVPGTKMAYAGQKDPAQEAAIADYLMSLK